MDELLWNVDWHGIIALKNSVLEVTVRGSIMYFLSLA